MQDRVDAQRPMVRHAINLESAAISNLPNPIARPDRARARTARAVPVPNELLARHRLIGAPGTEELRDRFGVLRSHVLRAMEQNGWQVVGITSACRGEGKTWTAVNLAISISRQLGRSALLVDGNLRRPAVHNYFELETQDGLASYLRQGTRLDRLLVYPLIGDLTVLPAGPATVEASDFLASPRMHALMQDIRASHASGTIIVDLPAIRDGDDVLCMLSHVDALLLVIEDGATSQDDLALAVETISGASIIGSVLNKSQEDT